MKLPLPTFRTTEVHPIDTAKSAVKSVGSGLASAGDTVAHASPAGIAKGAGDAALGVVHGAGKLLSFVGKKLEGSDK